MYSVREGMLGFRRAPMATTVSVTIVSITLTLFGLFALLTYNIQQLVNMVRSRMTVEIFIDYDLTDNERMRLEDRIRQVKGVTGLFFISKEEALRRFREDFGDDPLELLGENPLPASFQIQLDPAFRVSGRFQSVMDQLSALDGVDEVVGHNKLFQVVDQYSYAVMLIDSVIFILVLISTVFLVANSLRLTIIAQKRTVQIMELVGATRAFIRRPYLIQGLLQGGIGGAIASLVVWGAVQFVSLRIPNLLTAPLLLLVVPLVMGLLLGLIGSEIGLKRFLPV